MGSDLLSPTENRDWVAGTLTSKGLLLFSTYGDLAASAALLYVSVRQQKNDACLRLISGMDRNLSISCTKRLHSSAGAAPAWAQHCIIISPRQHSIVPAEAGMMTKRARQYLRILDASLMPNMDMGVAKVRSRHFLPPVSAAVDTNNANQS